MFYKKGTPEPLTIVKEGKLDLKKGVCVTCGKEFNEEELLSLNGFKYCFVCKEDLEKSV